MKKILIVVDMQNDFIDGSLGSLEAKDIVVGVADLIKNWDGDIICTLDTHSKDYLNTNEGINLPVKHCIKGTTGHEINSLILESLKTKNYKTIEKPTFGSMNLINYIKDNYDINDVEFYILGLCTDICVVSNALLLKANFYENNIFCFENLCAGVTPDLHKSALNTMKSCQIKLLEA